MTMGAPSLAKSRPSPRPSATSSGATRRSSASQPVTAKARAQLDPESDEGLAFLGDILQKDNYDTRRR